MSSSTATQPIAPKANQAGTRRFDCALPGIEEAKGWTTAIGAGLGTVRMLAQVGQTKVVPASPASMLKERPQVQGTEKVAMTPPKCRNGEVGSATVCGMRRVAAMLHRYWLKCRSTKWPDIPTSGARISF